jgi:hypothetical protein
MRPGILYRQVAARDYRVPEGIDRHSVNYHDPRTIHRTRSARERSDIPFIFIFSMVLWQLVGAGLAAALAVGVGWGHKHHHRKVTNAATIYVIGDLHGDATCAAYWVDRLGLVDAATQQWLQPSASLVFMGDYIDKGPTSLQTLEFVKNLTDSFPNKVTALLGNHEMELLKDRDANVVVKYMQLPYATVHPQEYLNFLERPADEKDHLVVDLLLNASLEVYANQWHQRILVAATADPRYGRTAVTEIFEESLQPLLKERLVEYQASYLKAFGSNTSLGQWLEQRPVAHVQEGVLFCHGGINREIAAEIIRVGSIDALNNLVGRNSHESKYVSFLEDTPSGNTVAEMLVYRGNHKAGACPELGHLLEDLGVERLVVGHTPAQNVRSMCNDQLWAVDSLLGRWIRTSGNYYCPTSRRQSQDGKFVCDALEKSCQGQVVKMQRGLVEVIS